MEGKNHLFAIAIDRYKHYPSLSNAVKDVEEVVHILTQLYQFEKEDVHTLFNEEATEDNIDEKFLELVDLIKENDNLIVFYSGHGYYRESVKEGYWIPSDGRQDKVADYITNANLIRYLQNMKAHHLLMMVDSCFSGALVEQLRGNDTSEKLPSRRVFASGRTETVSDGLPGQNSPFAKGIIDALKERSEGSITSTELIRSVKRFVEGRVGQEPVEGRLRDSKDNRGEFVFRRKLTESEFWDAAKKKNTLESYESYLSIYPEGHFSYDAHKELRACKAMKALNKAAASDTIPDYEDFLHLYYDSSLIQKARERIKELKKAENERRQAELERAERLKAQAREEEEIESRRKQYKKMAREGKKAMDAGDYRLARKRFGECELLFRNDAEGFIPSITEVKANKLHCTTELRYAEYLEDGKRALKIRDYKTAIALFQGALKIIPGSLDVMRLKDTAERLMQATGTVDVPQKGPNKGKGAQPSPDAPKPRKGIKIKTRPRPPRPPLSITVSPKAGTPKAPPLVPALPKPKLGMSGKTTTPRKKPERDFTYLWITLLVVAYFLLLELLGIFR